MSGFAMPVSRRPDSVTEGPASAHKITYPGSLAARLGNLAVAIDELPSLPLRTHAETPGRAGTRPVRWRTDSEFASSGNSFAEAPIRPEDFASQALHRGGRCEQHRHAWDRVLPVDPKLGNFAAHAQVQALVRDFHRRQRQASVLVAASIATACVLTFGCMAVVIAQARPAGTAEQADARSTSVAPRSDVSSLRAEPVSMRVTTNQALKGARLLVPIKAEQHPDALLDDAVLHARDVSAPKLIIATPDRPLALGPLLSPRLSPYLLLRGLPSGARLSAGLRNGNGTWIVKSSEVRDLTLRFDRTEGAAPQVAGGDYPIDVFALGEGEIPQDRQSLVLRVQSEAASNTDASAAAAPDSMALLAQAKHLLAEGNVDEARVVLLHLAEQGDRQAVFVLARSFDSQAPAPGAAGRPGTDADSMQ